MSSQQFRIETTDSQYRRCCLLCLLLVFIASIWTWQFDVIKYQVFVQGLLSLVFVAYLLPKIVQRETDAVFMLEESGRVVWLMPQEQVSWEISHQSRGCSWWHWLVLVHPLMDRTRRVIIFKDSVSDENWRHLSRVLNRRIRIK